MQAVSDRAHWSVKVYTFKGKVQLKAFRKELMLPINRCGLAGFIRNSHVSNDIVYALLGGKPEDLFTFSDLCKDLFKDDGVEITSETANVRQEVLPLPATRIENTGDELGDRIDEALGYFRIMIDKLDQIIENTEPTKRIEKNTEKIIVNTERIYKCTDEIPAMKESLKRIEENTSRSS